MMSRILPNFVLRPLYFAYFHSHLTYGLPIWYPLLSVKLQNSLYVLQKRIIRSMHCVNPLQHCMPLFKKSQIKDQLHMENCRLMHRVNSGDCPPPILNLYDFCSQQHNTRGPNIRIVKHKSVLVNKSFLCKPLSNWQRTDIAIRNIMNLKGFCKNLRRKLIDKY